MPDFRAEGEIQSFVHATKAVYQQSYNSNPNKSILQNIMEKSLWFSIYEKKW